MNNDELILFFKNKNILITGGTGLIGRFIVDKLCSYEAKVTVVSLDDLTLNDSAKYIKGDLTNFEFCKEITKNVDYAFHVSGIKGSVKVTIEKPASFFVPLLMMNIDWSIRALLVLILVEKFLLRAKKIRVNRRWICFQGGQKEWLKCRFRHTKNNIT